MLLRLAVASKEGDWILREDHSTLEHVLAVLEAHGAKYRFGAPLDLRWLRGGWSAHLEFQQGALRVRTDFFTRPPRLTAAMLERLWHEQEGREIPFTGPRELLEMKKTAREKDWPFVGELARLLDNPREQMLCSRSAHDLVALASTHPELVRELAPHRPILGRVSSGIDDLRRALDDERRAAMDEDDRRVRAYLAASVEFEREWQRIHESLVDLPLREAHDVLVESAQRWLPTTPGGSPPAISS